MNSSGNRRKPDELQLKSRRRRRRHVAVSVLLALLITGELVARFYFQLGDPPLLMADPQIEYLYRPNQDCRRFGSRIRYNSHCMRSDEFPTHKADPAELRVMVVGDSIVNGGNPTDQANLATTLIAPRLSAALRRPVTVGNISAGSWGPPNQLAYLQKYGLFDADVVVIVISSHDATDVPTFTPTVGVDPGFPDRRPVSALIEAFSRYGVDGIRQLMGSAERPPVPSTTPPASPPDPASTKQALSALTEMIAMVQRSGATVILLQYPEEIETRGAFLPGHDLIAAAASEAGATVVQLLPAIQARQAMGETFYRDPIHPTDLGQQVLAEEIVKSIEKSLVSKAPMPSAG